MLIPTDKPSASRKMRSPLLQRLSTINWDFPHSNSAKSIHSFHSYPARFIPEIPRTLLREIAPPHEALILDPFCGCGTTLVEAERAGFSSCGIDLNPIGCLISRVKTTRIPRNFLNAAARCVVNARSRNAPPPMIPNLLHWFDVEVCRALAALSLSVVDVADAVTREALKAVLSSIIVRVSNQDSDTRYASVPKGIGGDDVFIAFSEAARNLASLEQVSTSRPTKVTILNKNIFDVQPKDIPGDVGLVITSPPYPNAYEYWLYHKYRMWWLGYDPIAVKGMEIGARAHFFSGRRKKEDFHRQMSQVLALLKETMCKGALCCFVVGDSKIHGAIVDNADTLLSAASKHQFKLVLKTDRLIKPSRKSFNLHHARIKREHVLIWER